MPDSKPTELSVQDDMVVAIDYTLWVEGEVVDQSGADVPLQFIQGQGQIIQGLEDALYDMTVGESKEIQVLASAGYGEIDDEAYAEIPLKQFHKGIPLEIGVELQLRDEDGDVFDAYIEEIHKDYVLLNLNHPLAGLDLLFSVTINEIRPASPEELEHGHVHEHEDDE